MLLSYGAFLFLPQFVGRGLPLDKSSGMGIIINRRGRCDKRSAPELVNDFNGLYSPQKPSPAGVAVFVKSHRLTNPVRWV